jgi:SAM-dependent methyltransferase
MPTIREGNQLELSADDYENFYREQAMDGTEIASLAWDIGGPQPLVVQWHREGKITGPVLDAGCGRGHNSLYLAEQGLDVTGFDRSDTAVIQARAIASDRTLTTGSVTFRTADALSMDLREQGPFQTILDSCLYHCLTETERHLYAAHLHAHAGHNARLLLICFSDQAPPGLPGPFRISQENLHQTLTPAGWDITSITASTYQTRWDRKTHEGLVRAAGFDAFATTAPDSTTANKKPFFPLPVWTVTAERL